MDADKTIRCAIYTRKSTEKGLEQEFNSLDAQREACAAYITARKFEGWRLVNERYDDGGYTGGNLKRPAFRRLMQDVADGKVDMIVCYKLDRLSRRLVDFVNVLKELDANHASFTCVTQEFSTATSSGRMMMNLLITFAQYEREMTADRIRDKIESSKRLGLWTGGTIPYGYKIVKNHLIPNPATKDNVRHIFRMFLETGSKTLVCRKLAEEGILRFPAKGTHWRVGHLNAVLRNRVYIGEIRAGDKSYPGVHEAILDKGLWEKVQAKLSDRTVSHRRGLHISEKAPLSGLVKCGTCGSPMTYNWTSKKHNRVLYGYYIDLADAKRPFPTCPVRRVSADRLEKVVDGIILKFLRLPMIERTIAGELGWMMHEVDRMLGVQDLLWRNLLPDEKRELIRLLIGGVTIFPNAAEVKMRTSGCKPLIEEMKNDFTNE